MSETKTKMTKEELLEVFKSEYKNVLRQYERKVERYAIKMNEDYEYFFRWCADEMYKAQVNLKTIRELRTMISWDNPDKIKTWLGNHIDNIELNLIEGSQYPTSTGIMHNVAQTLLRVAQQELRVDLRRLIWTITCNE